jgi:gliding motility-associated lipoprotein GldD
MTIKRPPVNILFLFFAGITMALLLYGCSTDYSPRPKDYPYIELLPKEYKVYSPQNCPFTFEYPIRSEIVMDTFSQVNKPETDCWFNIFYPAFNATIYLSYKNVDGNYSLERLRDDAYRLTYEHVSKAEYIEPNIIETPNHVFSVVYDVGGDAASATQFFITDTTNHWLRGSLYFKTIPNADSLAPVVQYINKDILHLIQTLHWKDEPDQ